MTIETVSTAYQNGRRVAQQKVTFEKSDDLFALANLYRQHEIICTQIAAAAPGVDTEVLGAEKTRVEAEITLQQSYVDGYSGYSQ